jgi:hypothetical protein
MLSQPLHVRQCVAALNGPHIFATFAMLQLRLPRRR